MPKVNVGPTWYKQGEPNKVASLEGNLEGILIVFSPEMLYVWWQSALCCGSASLGPELGFAGARMVDWRPPALQINSRPPPGDENEQPNYNFAISGGTFGMRTDESRLKKSETN